MTGFVTRRLAADALGRIDAPAHDAVAAAAGRLGGRALAGAPAIFDLETTGLGVADAIAFVVGVAGYDGHGRLEIHQLRLDAPAGEPAMWDHVAALLLRLGRHGVVSYNGASFDRHLAMIRMRRLGLWTPRLREILFDGMIDLLPICRRVFGHRHADRRLLALECSELGAPPRVGDRSGLEIAAIGQAWLAGTRSPQDQAELDAVLHHNALDLVGTAALVLACDAACEHSHAPADVLAAARQWIAAGRPEHARARLRGALVHHRLRRADPVGIELALRLAELDRRAGDREAAARTWRAIAAAWPGHPIACEALAKDCEHRLGDPVQALVWALAGGCDARRIDRLRRKTEASGTTPWPAVGETSARAADAPRPQAEVYERAPARSGEPTAAARRPSASVPTPHPRLGAPGSWRV